MVAACEETADRLERLGVGVTVWDVRLAAPLDGSMVADAARHRLVLSAEDGIADGGVGATIATALRGAAVGDDGPVTLTLGLPRAFLPHGGATRILADAGLDGAGWPPRCSAPCRRYPGPNGTLAAERLIGASRRSAVMGKPPSRIEPSCPSEIQTSSAAPSGWRGFATRSSTTS